MAPASLLTLPPELRNIIYEESLVYGTQLSLRPKDRAWSSPLLEVCTKIRAESSKLFYARNTFYYSAYGMKAQRALPILLKSLGPMACLVLRRLEIMGPTDRAGYNIKHSIFRLDDGISNGQKFRWIITIVCYRASRDRLAGDSMEFEIHADNMAAATDCLDAAVAQRWTFGINCVIRDSIRFVAAALDILSRSRTIWIALRSEKGDDGQQQEPCTRCWKSACS